MTSMIKGQIQEDMKAAMRSHEKERLATIRLILAALKQREVDERIELSDEQVFLTLDKMVKQRRQSIEEFSKANRPELVAKETEELKLIQHYLPTQLTPEEVNALIEATIQETGATSARDMGKVMSALKPKLQGRADMTLVSAQIKQLLIS